MLLGVLFLKLFIASAFSIYETEFEFLPNFHQLFSLLPVCTHVLVCIMIVLGIRIRFRVFNEILLKNHRIFHLANLHVSLNEIIESFNETFSLSIAIFSGANLNALVMMLFTFYLTITSNEKGIFSYSIKTTLWIILLLSLNFSFVILCSLVTREIKKSKTIVEVKILKSKNEKTKRNLKIFLMQLKHGEMKFSCGLFEFDWRFFTMVRNTLRNLE